MAQLGCPIWHQRSSKFQSYNRGSSFAWYVCNSNISSLLSGAQSHVRAFQARKTDAWQKRECVKVEMSTLTGNAEAPARNWNLETVMNLKPSMTTFNVIEGCHARVTMPLEILDTCIHMAHVGAFKLARRVPTEAALTVCAVLGSTVLIRPLPKRHNLKQLARARWQWQH